MILIYLYGSVSIIPHQYTETLPLLNPSKVVFEIYLGALNLLIAKESIINSYKKAFCWRQRSSELKDSKNHRQGARYIFFSRHNSVFLVPEFSLWGFKFYQEARY